MYKYFFNRKVAFLKEASAIVLFPGGFGTLDEAMETITLIQTGKQNPMPLILVDEPGGTYWTNMIHFFEEELMKTGYISSSDFNLFERVDSLSAVIRSIGRFYHRYHSLRYVENQLVLRLESGLEQQAAKDLQERFQDILSPGGRIFLSGALPDEADEPEIAGLQRIVVDFNRKDFGRLRRLIDAVNAY